MSEQPRWKLARETEPPVRGAPWRYCPCKCCEAYRTRIGAVPAERVAERVRVMVSGSRGWRDRDAIREAFMRWQVTTGVVDVTLIHGGAQGADTLAHDEALRLGWKVDVHKADWDKHRPPPGSKRKNPAGVIRNVAMLDSEPSHVFIFWDGESRGTKQVIQEVQKRHQSYEITRSASPVSQPVFEERSRG